MDPQRKNVGAPALQPAAQYLNENADTAVALRLGSPLGIEPPDPLSA